MKKFTKVSLIIAAGFAVCGSLLLLIAASMGAGYHTLRQIVADSSYIGWYDADDDWFGTHHNDVWESEGNMFQTFDCADVENIELNISAAEIIFTEAVEDDIITVDLQKGYTNKFACDINSGTLEINYKLNGSITKYKSNSKIYIKIPRGMEFGAMDLDVGASSLKFETETIFCKKMIMDVGAGDVELENAEIADRLDIKLGVGRVEISDGIFTDIKLDCGIGEIDMEGSVSGDITAHCGMGQIDMELRGNESDYNYDLSCGMGSLIVNGSRYSNIGGSRNVKNEGATKTLKLDCGMGDLEVEIHP